MDANGISKIIKRVFAGVVAIIVAIGRIINGKDKDDCDGTGALGRTKSAKNGKKIRSHVVNAKAKKKEA